MHRVAQLVSHLTARVGTDELATARRVLPRRAWALFEAMPVADQRHGLDVARRLLDRGLDDPDLLGAALLHDAAKGRRLRLWHRVGGVLLAAIARPLLRRLAGRRPLEANPWYVFVHHAALSAAAARDAGLSERAAAFISGRAAAVDGPLAEALHAADEAS